MVTTLEKSACLECKQDFLATLNALKIYTNFFMFTQPYIKLMTLMLPLPTLSTEEKINTCMDWLHPSGTLKTANYSRKWGFMHQDTSQWTKDGKEETGKSWVGRGHYVTGISYNECPITELWTWKTHIAVVMRCPLSFEFLISCTLHCR